MTEIKKSQSVNSEEKENQSGPLDFTNILSASKEHYLDVIGQEALSRSGECPQLKGVVHELLFRDKLNLTPSNLLKGRVTKLSENPIDQTVDLVTTDSNGKVTDTYQLKDCTSQSGVDKTLSQARNGKYQKAKLMGTKETTKKYNSRKATSDQDMKSTGVSSKRTGRVADNAGIEPLDKKTIAGNFLDIGSCAKASALTAGGIEAVSTLVSGLSSYCDGDITGLELAEELVTKTVKTSAKAGATTAAALSLKEGGKALGSCLGSQTLRRVAGSNAATATAF
ncbi:MAG: hypothetical protein LBE31_05790, partial [Deltaproteobacteria bacterium]|nr:hypothetical protein [Deltaproteobacteria bacterium]